MIKVKIYNGKKNTEIAFPCKEQQLTKALDSIGADGKQFAPTLLVTEIEPKELFVLENEAVNLDELNYLARLMDGFDKQERKRFFAVLSLEDTDELDMKRLINLAINLPRYTLVKDVSNLEEVGKNYLMNVHGGLPVDELKNKEWLISEGKKLLNSGKGIATEYGLLFESEDVPFEEAYDGKVFPAYCDSEDIAEITFTHEHRSETLFFPTEELAIQKAIARLGANQPDECEFTIEALANVSNDIADSIREAITSKDIFGVNKLLISQCSSQEMLFRSEVGRKLSEMGIEYSDEVSHISIKKGGENVAKIHSNGGISGHVDYVTGDEYPKVQKIARLASEYCKAYAEAKPLSANSLGDKYRCLAEYNETVFAAKYNAGYGFEFVVWLRTIDGNSVFQGHYFGDYTAAKEDFAKRSGLINSDRVFSDADIKNLLHCVEFALNNDEDMSYSLYQEVKELKEKIERVIPEPQQDVTPDLSM